MTPRPHHQSHTMSQRRGAYETHPFFFSRRQHECRGNRRRRLPSIDASVVHAGIGPAGTEASKSSAVPAIPASKTFFQLLTFILHIGQILHILAQPAHVHLCMQGKLTYTHSDAWHTAQRETERQRLLHSDMEHSMPRSTRLVATLNGHLLHL
jgi:hypothetical protein